MRSDSIIHRLVLRRRSLLVPLAGLLLTAQIGSADFLLTSLDGEGVRGISLAANQAQVTLATASGVAHRAPTSSVIQITVVPEPPPPPAASRPFEVELRDGSRLRGMLEPGGKADFRLRSPVLEDELDLSLDDVLAIRRVAGGEIPGAARLVRIPDKDAAYSRVGKRLEGFVSRFTGTGVEIDRKPLKALEIAYGDLAAVFVDNPKLPRPEGLHVVARMADGSSLVLGQDFRVHGGELTGTTISGLRYRAPIGRVVAFGFQGGKFVHVSDLTPKEIVRKPFFPVPEGGAKAVYLDFIAPVRFDKSPDVRRISLRGRTYFKGIGVRPTTRLTYDLDGKYREFRALCGIDDEVLGAGYGHGSGYGSVVFRVEADGKEIYRSPPQHGGREPARVKLNVAGTKILTLEVGLVPKAKMPKGSSDSPELDNAVWARPLLIR